MEALSFVLSLSFFPPKESYSVVQDAEERREKGVTMNSILNSLFLRVLIGFFFSRVLKKQLFWHIKKARENTEREQKREKENSREHRKRAEKRKREFEEEEHKHTPRERNFSTFWSKNASQNYTISLKTSESTSS